MTPTKMGVADGFKGAGMMAKVAFVLLLIAALFAWIGYCCPAWGRQDNAGSNNDNFFGLWRYCSNGLYVSSCNSIDGWALGNKVLSYRVHLFDNMSV